MSGPHTNSRTVISLPPSRSSEAGMSAICGVLRSGRLALASRRESSTTTPLTATSTALLKRGRNTDQPEAASPLRKMKTPV
ncbi:hypothetical protein ACVL92_001240 [Bradyrhizobium liaoningense]